jgi:hypothetical protein
MPRSRQGRRSTGGGRSGRASAATAALLAALALSSGGAAPAAAQGTIGALPQVPANLAAAAVAPPPTAMGAAVGGVGGGIPGTAAGLGAVPGAAAGVSASEAAAGTGTGTNELVDHDMSPVCQATLPQCRAECAPKQGTVMLYQCSAGNGLNGGPAINCQCVIPGKPSGGDQAAILQLVDQPGGRACNSKTWINDCATQMRAVVTGASVVLTPAISDFMGQRCQSVAGIVLGANQVALSMSTQYPIGISTSAPDGTVQIQFSQTGDERYANCYATYKVAQGTFLNGPPANAQGRGRGAAGAAAAVDPAAMAAAMGAADPAAGEAAPKKGGKSLSLGGGDASGAGASVAAKPAAAVAAAALGLLGALAAL